MLIKTDGVFIHTRWHFPESCYLVLLPTYDFLHDIFSLLGDTGSVKKPSLRRRFTRRVIWNQTTMSSRDFTPSYKWRDKRKSKTNKFFAGTSYTETQPARSNQIRGNNFRLLKRQRNNILRTPTYRATGMEADLFVIFTEHEERKTCCCGKKALA